MASRRRGFCHPRFLTASSKSGKRPQLRREEWARLCCAVPEFRSHSPFMFSIVSMFFEYWINLSTLAIKIPLRSTVYGHFNECRPLKSHFRKISDLVTATLILSVKDEKHNRAIPLASAAWTLLTLLGALSLFSLWLFVRDAAPRLR